MSDEKNRKQKKPKEFFVGELDNDGVEVKKLYAKGPSFVVYRTTTSIRVDFDDFHKDTRTYVDNHHKISIALARIYSWLPENISNSEPINKLIGRAITTNIAGNTKDAHRILAHAEERIIKLQVLKGRLQYTISAVLVTIGLYVAASYFEGLKDSIFSKVIFFGALGGLMSIAIGYGNLHIDIDATRRTNCLVGASRILIAVIASVFSYLAIKSGVAFNFLKDAPDNTGIYLIAITAGFVEMLVPNMLNNLANDGSDIKTGGGAEKSKNKEFDSNGKIIIETEVVKAAEAPVAEYANEVMRLRKVLKGRRKI